MPDLSASISEIKRAYRDRDLADALTELARKEKELEKLKDENKILKAMLREHNRLSRLNEEQKENLIKES